jgi:signal transduction histidine kinase
MQAAVGVVTLVSLVALATAVGLAAFGGRRLARPLAALADHASRLGGGEVGSRAPRTGLSEIDAVAEVLDQSATRIGAMLQAEREFTANASHQLRTPLTALRLRLEPLLLEDEEEAGGSGPGLGGAGGEGGARGEGGAGSHGSGSDLRRPGGDTHEAAWRPAVQAALAEADRLEATIDALLALPRTVRAGPARPFDLAALLAERARHWAAPLGEAHRALSVHLGTQTPGDRMTALASPDAVGQAVDVLLENGLRHGGGRITLSLRRSGLFGVVVVEDEGKGITLDEEAAIFERGRSQGGTGIGLALARSLMEADGGRLELASPYPVRFELYVPLALSARAGQPGEARSYLHPGEP